MFGAKTIIFNKICSNSQAIQQQQITSIYKLLYKHEPYTN